MSGAQTASLREGLCLHFVHLLNENTIGSCVQRNLTLLPLCLLASLIRIACYNRVHTHSLVMHMSKFFVDLQTKGNFVLRNEEERILC